MRSGLFILIVLIFSLLSCESPSSQGTQWRVGAASTNVNPPLGSFIAGDKQNRRFTGVRDSLYVKALAIADGEKNTIVMVTIDCIGLLYDDVQRIRMQAAAHAQHHNLLAERVIVSSSHTHSGPDVVGLWGEHMASSGVDSTYLADLIAKASTTVLAALDNLQPADIYYAETTAGHEWVANISDVEIDRSVTTLQFKSGGATIATLTNFACHPTFLDAKYEDISADYVSAFYKTLTNTLGGEHLFVQGAIGGWVQPVDEVDTHVKVDERGTELAQVVIGALADAQRLAGNGIAFNSKKVDFPVENDGWRQLASIGTINRKVTETITSEIAWFRIGNAQFVTHPGETTPYHGLLTKELMSTEPKFVIGLGLDALGYILKPVFFEDSTQQHAAYLTSMSLGKETAPTMMKVIEELVKSSESSN